MLKIVSNSRFFILCWFDDFFNGFLSKFTKFWREISNHNPAVVQPRRLTKFFSRYIHSCSNMIPICQVFTSKIVKHLSLALLSTKEVVVNPVLLLKGCRVGQLLEFWSYLHEDQSLKVWSKTTLRLQKW